ncbi:MAG: hypothetical protein ACREKN_02505 [Longimicrobiaceae bacterium]
MALFAAPATPRAGWWRWFRLFSLVLPLITFVPLGAQVLGESEEYDYENLELRGFGLEVGSIWLARIEPTLEAAVRADLGFLGPRIRIVPRLSFWSSFVERSEVERLSDQFRELCERQHPADECPRIDFGEVRRSDLILALDAHYVREVGGIPFTPYAGAGLGLHFLNGRGEAIDDTFVEDLLSSVSPGLNLLVGVELGLWESLRFLAEGRLTATTDVRYAGMTFGGVWFFPTPVSP